MNKLQFEKRYMEKSWQKKRIKSYRTSDVDESIKKFSKFIQKKKVKGSLLDLGCGNGRNTIFFAKKGFDSLGMDFAPSAIKVCQSNTRKNKSKAKFISGDVLSYNFKSKFDVVIDCGCLHHVRKQFWNKYRKNLLKTIKEGGYFYLHGISDSVKNKNLPKHPNKRKWILKNGHYTGFFSKEDIFNYFVKDFKIIKTYEFQSQGSPLWVRAFWMRKI